MILKYIYKFKVQYINIVANYMTGKHVLAR